MALSKVVNAHFPTSQAKDIFVHYSTHFAVHQPSEEAQFYVTLFDIQPTLNSTAFSTAMSATLLPQQSELVLLNSDQDLEIALVQIIQRLTVSTPGSSISVSNVGSEFHRLYGEPITKIIKRFNLGKNFPNYLMLCPSFKVEKTANGWQVSLA